MVKAFKVSIVILIHIMPRKNITDLPLQLIGTPFQKNIWQMLQNIPFGGTVSYQDLANNANSPKAARAIGSANAKNPIVIIIPCHRVIKSDGQIGGYAGGVACKRQLLELEGSSPCNKIPTF
ncbi:methylated-DNA--[protein]-cysteine S-methyltransferase [Cysteiniphilum sp. 6C5]|uniref:methylated-DNA--[protein]-cysteine S-methyltransferase n=1 Tax=unclassified Cysteiniphilum TaxID=2610889 RepID=UPI003F85AA68